MKEVYHEAAMLLGSPGHVYVLWVSVLAEPAFDLS